MRLPEKTRATLERFIKNMKNNHEVSAVALFGSWSRGDAVAASDVDLLIVHKTGVEEEYVERREFGGLLIDLDHVPEKSIIGQVPPEIDQKLYEAYILYDRDWTLTTVKNRVARNYASRERVDIRTEAHLLDADIYFSRASSAFAREDIESATVFAALSVEEALKILLETLSMPLSNSRLIGSFETVTAKEGCADVFSTFLLLSHIQNETKETVERKLLLFKTILSEITGIVKDHDAVLQSLHFKVRSKLEYYCTSAFLQGMVLRSRSLIDSQGHSEAAHYLCRALIDILENYAWLKSAITDIKFDYTTLFRSLKNLEKTSLVYKNAVEAFNIVDVDRETTQNTVRLAKQAIQNIRRRRKDLIARNFGQ